jgi:hypothetical protein
VNTTGQRSPLGSGGLRLAKNDTALSRDPLI